MNTSAAAGAAAAASLICDIPDYFDTLSETEETTVVEVPVVDHVDD